jgi:hypothetical protein
MWKVYGDRECAIQSTYEKIKLSFSKSPVDITGGKIKYIDYEREEFPIGNTFISVSYKDIVYKDESELRLLFWKVSELNQNFPVEEAGVKVPVNVDFLIENIYINPTKIINTDSLIALKRSMSLSFDIRKSRIKE